MALTAAERRKIVSMYKAGKRTAEITAETGAARSTIYYVLDEEGITPARQNQRRSGPSGSDMPPAEFTRTLDWYVQRVADLEGLVARLEERLRLARAALD